METTSTQSSRLTILLIGLVVVAALAGLVLLFLPKKAEITAPLATPPTILNQPLPSPAQRILTSGEVHLSLVPEPSSIKIGQQFDLSVVVEPGTFGVSGVETHFTYNPSVIKILKIEPGTYFKTPDILIENIDARIGSLDYAIASRTRSTGSGTVFTIRTQAVGITNNLEVAIEFRQNETKVGLSSTTKNERLGEAQTKVIFDQQPFSITK